MITPEKRKNFRTESLRLLNYISYDKVEVEAAQGMGRTLNVSVSGIMLETHHPLDIDQIISLRIGFEENVVDVRGRVIYTHQNSQGMYQSGIEFFDLDDTALLVLRQYSMAFNADTENHPR